MRDCRIKTNKLILDIIEMYRGSLSEAIKVKVLECLAYIYICICCSRIAAYQISISIIISPERPEDVQKIKSVIDR